MIRKACHNKRVINYEILVFSLALGLLMDVLNLGGAVDLKVF